MLLTPPPVGPELHLQPQALQGFLRRIVTNRVRGGSYDMTVERGIELEDIVRSTESFCRALSRAVLERTHVFSQAALRVRSVRGKDREFTSFAVSDLVVHYAASAMVAQVFAHSASRFVYSYVPGRSYDRAVAALAAYVQHCQKGQPRQDLYVLRLDVARYFESIAVHRDAALWTSLRAGLRRVYGASGVETAMWLLERTLRPELRLPDGGSCSRTVGLPIGTPVALPVSNLYLLPIDAYLENHPGAFFARYGDDIIYCHADPERVLDVESQVRARLGNLGLSVSEEKSARVRLSASGAQGGHAAFHGAQFVNFLGLAVGATGRLRLQEAHVAKLLRELRVRASRVAYSFADEPLEERTRALHATLREALDTKSPFRAKHTRPFANVRIDRAQRRYLEHELALLVARSATGVLGVRALRELRTRLGAEARSPTLVPKPSRVLSRG